MTDDGSKLPAFVKHACDGRNAAFEVADRLEDAGLVCWIAPRDVRAGQGYGAEIILGDVERHADSDDQADDITILAFRLKRAPLLYTLSPFNMLHTENLGRPPITYVTTKPF